jgi:hypothetical protein
MNIPKDPIMLMSYLNTQLRDKYSSLADLTEDLELDEKEISDKLSAAGFIYDSEANKFINK